MLSCMRQVITSAGITAHVGAALEKAGVQGSCPCGGIFEERATFFETTQKHRCCIKESAPDIPQGKINSKQGRLWPYRPRHNLNRSTSPLNASEEEPLRCVSFVDQLIKKKNLISVLFRVDLPEKSRPCTARRPADTGGFRL